MSSRDRNAKRYEIPSINSVSPAYNICSPFAYLAGKVWRAYHKLTSEKVSAKSVSEGELTSFRCLVDQAMEIHSSNPDAMASFVAAILRPLQSEQILSVAEREEHGAVDEIKLWQMFSEDAFFSLFDERDCLRPDATPYRMKFSRHIVLTTPWRRDRFADALALIGDGKKLGAWRQDANHRISMILPWKFGIVNGGNHSIAAGILCGEGEACPSDVHDLSPLLSRVCCDGQYYIDVNTGVRVARVSNYRMAALYEIGRVMTGDY